MINTILLILISIASCLGVVAFIMVMNKKFCNKESYDNKKSCTRSTSQPTSQPTSQSTSQLGQLLTSGDCGVGQSRVDDSNCTYGGFLGIGSKTGCPSGQICCKNDGGMPGVPPGFTQCVLK